MIDPDSPTSRRRVLQLGGVAAIAAIAGCGDADEEANGDDEDDPAEGDEEGSETEDPLDEDEEDDEDGGGY